MEKMHNKVDENYIKEYFSDDQLISIYKNAVDEIGLWASEKIFYYKHLPLTGRILDIGCGTGRTTFNLYRMGYTNIIGLDLTPKMIDYARDYGMKNSIGIEFVVGDACNLSFEDNSFDACLFSFNGLMHIPTVENRIKALSEISRVLNSNGIFIFTSMDRNMYPHLEEYWKKEKEAWDSGVRDPRVYEFGDRISESKAKNKPVFIHIPSYDEIISCLDIAGMEVVENLLKENIAAETDDTQKFISRETRFWSVKKS